MRKSLPLAAIGLAGIAYALSAFADISELSSADGRIVFRNRLAEPSPASAPPSTRGPASVAQASSVDAVSTVQDSKLRLLRP
jgi:hypothetical protein